MKTFQTHDPSMVEDLVVVLRQMGYVAHRAGIATVDAYVRAPRRRSRIRFDRPSNRGAGELRSA